ncbi:uncharacterized protein LOC134821829 isoform X1 [Bolinopsis microptera]|uniref:uncharacterized protein LOC134821829 isoform X1 n=1 Tax=Bolinopsis microptera TaxID=2820187 RepID=UPI0030792A45
MAEFCLRVKDRKSFATEIRCGEDECCYVDRVFTLITEQPPPTNCLHVWGRCLQLSPVVGLAGLSDLEKIWLIVLCVLIFIVLLVIIYFATRIVTQKKGTKKRSVGTESNIVINVEATEMKPRLVEAAQTVACNAGLHGIQSVRTDSQEKEPDNLKEKLTLLIQAREEEKLAAFLETVEGYYEGQIDQSSLLKAKGVLKAWKIESELQNYCDKTECLQPGEVVGLQRCLEESSHHDNHIYSIIIRHAKRRLSSELGKQNMINELKVQMKEAMHSNDLEQLEKLVDIIRAKQLDREFETELWYAQCQFEKNSKNRLLQVVERDLSAAMECRDSAALNRAIQRAEQSEDRIKLTKQMDEAKRALGELRELEKLKNLHKLKITNAIRSKVIQRMEQTLHDVKVDGFGEDLKAEICDLEMALKRKYLQKRLKGNLNVAIQFLQNLDLVRLRRAINEATTAGFLSELGIELDEGLLSKLERLELIKKAVMELTNGHIAEIKSYSAPPVQVHKVLMALLIVLGEEPELVRDWFEIQVLLVKTGKLSLKRRIQEYNAGNLSTSSAKRAANIIGDIQSEELHSISKAAKVFYLWTSAVVEDRLAQDVIQ